MRRVGRHPVLRGPTRLLPTVERLDASVPAGHTAAPCSRARIVRVLGTRRPHAPLRTPANLPRVRGMLLNDRSDADCSPAVNYPITRSAIITGHHQVQES